MNKKLLSHLALFAVAVIYAANFTIAKTVMADGFIGPNAFILCRILFAFALFWVYHRLFIKEKIEKKDKMPLFWCGVFGVAINQLCFFKGLSMTSPIHASLIMTTTPILVLIIESVFTGLKLTAMKILGVALACLGALFIIISGKTIAFNQDAMLGDIFIFINAVSYGIYLVKVRPFIGKYHPMTINKINFMYGLIVVIPFGFPGLVQVNWLDFTPNAWAAFVYVLIFTTFLAYYFNAWAMLKVKSSVVGVYIYFQPLLTTIIALMVGSDSLDFVTIFSGLSILFGVFLVSFSKNTLK